LIDETGPGVIGHVWMTIASPEAHHLKNPVLRLYWDAGPAQRRDARRRPPLDPACPEGVIQFGPSRAESFLMDRYRGFHPRLLM
jgi:hypothetical protein